MEIRVAGLLLFVDLGMCHTAFSEAPPCLADTLPPSRTPAPCTFMFLRINSRLFCFSWFFKIGFVYVAQAVLELAP